MLSKAEIVMLMQSVSEVVQEYGSNLKASLTQDIEQREQNLTTRISEMETKVAVVEPRQLDQLVELGALKGAVIDLDAKVDAIKIPEPPDLTSAFSAIAKQIADLSEVKPPAPTDYTAQLEEIVKQIADRPQIPLEVVEQFDAVNKQLAALGEKPANPELMSEIEALRKQVELSTPNDEVDAKDFADALIGRFMREMAESE